MFSFFGLGKKYGALFLVANLGTVIYYTLFSVNNNIHELNELDLMGRIALMVELLVATFSISYVVYQFTIFHTYSYKGLSEANSELQNQHQVIDTKNNENTILIKEIHHRVKNNLQIVISLLRLHKNELKTEESKHHFQEAINRIMVMSLIHKKLYQDNLLAEIKIKDYLVDLTNDISKLSTLPIPIEVNVTSNIERVGLKTIVPLGLIINELMSNSIEHAFHKRSEAKIHISIKSLSENAFELMYYDNGYWSDQNEEYVSFGLELIEILTSQLEGTMNKSNSPEGTSYTFNLKDLDIEN
jgi:two-component sensor histidine kinase